MVADRRAVLSLPQDVKEKVLHQELRLPFLYHEGKQPKHEDNTVVKAKLKMKLQLLKHHKPPDSQICLKEM